MLHHSVERKDINIFTFFSLLSLLFFGGGEVGWNHFLKLLHMVKAIMVPWEKKHKPESRDFYLVFIMCQFPVLSIL